MAARAPDRVPSDSRVGRRWCPARLPRSPCNRFHSSLAMGLTGPGRVCAGEGGKVKDAHVCLTNRAGASLKETITKDHVKSGRTNIYNELRAWPTTSTQAQFAYEGYNFRPKVDEQARMAITGKLGDTYKPSKSSKSTSDRRFYHVSDEILNHYDCALRTGMKAR
eukprot:Tamp_24451.p1 GENE.Tamp_24451~~Tamp_24451.p1  ORF type:complete len:176 (-),score=20.42 Tamp_24451:460-954(-)